jgi:VCBS repeat-containing protein
VGYNISDISGDSTGGPDAWTFTLDLNDPGATTVSGDFNVVSLGGNDLGEATDGYVFSPLDTTGFGTLSVNGTDGTFEFTVDRAAVFASGSDQVVSFTVTGTSGPDSDDDTVAIEILICVLRGTRVDTPAGPVPVEDVAVGDLVVTRDRGARPVRWIGSRRLSPAELAADPTLRPVRIAAGALDGVAPLRDLVVSPQHRVLVTGWQAEMHFGEDEVLVPAKALVNRRDVCIEVSDEPVEYFHLMFDDHEVIFTEGAPTESFHAGPYALRELGDAARAELQHLFPGLFQPGGLPPTARMSLKPWEGRLLAPARPAQGGMAA